MSETLYPIAVLIEELKSEDTKRRVNSIRNIKQISVALGHERTRTELVPYLTELMDDEEEVLCALAEELGGFVEGVGGKMQAHTLFDPLEQLSQVEDSSVQNAAFKSIISILNSVDRRMLEEIILDMLNRMSTSEWPTSKIGAATILPHAISGVSVGIQERLLQIFATLQHDESALVRKSAAESLETLVSVLPADFESHLTSLFGDTIKDTDETVRMVAADVALKMIEKIQQAKVMAYVIPFIKAVPDDKAWRVRYVMATKITQFATKLGSEHTATTLVPIFTKFLSDSESEVRTGACNVLSDFCSVLLPEAIVSNLIPTLTALSNDTDVIKAMMGCHICKLAPIIGQSQTNTHLLPTILTLLRDENPDVRLSLFNTLEDLKNVIGSESLAQTINPAILELCDNKNWRVRNQIVDQLYDLGRQLGEEYFNENLLPVMVRFLADKVNNIRTQTLEEVCKLGDLFGNRWISDQILPELVNFKNSENYLQRIVLLLAFVKIYRFFDASTISSQLLPVINDLATDPVPNVRLNVAKTLKVLTSVVNTEHMKMMLRLLNKDEDTDVRYYADQALNAKQVILGF